MKDSPLLATTKYSNTDLDKVTKAIVPSFLINFLNTPIIKVYPIEINYWSVIHLLYGMFSAYIRLPFWMMLLFAILFEITEILLSNYTLFTISLAEWMDIMLDVLFSILGYFIVKKALLGH